MIADIVIRITSAGLERAAMVIAGGAVGFLGGVLTAQRPRAKR